MTCRPHVSTRDLRRALLILIAIAVLLIAACAPAFAQEENATPAPSGTAFTPYAQPQPVARRSMSTRSRWYGWQTLIADGASILGVPTVAGVTKAEPVAWLAVAGYFLATPIIHAAHRRVGIGLGSLGLRVAMPLAGAGIGLLTTGGCSRELCSIPILVGAAAGGLGAIALDAAALAYEDEDEEQENDAVAAPPRAVAQRTRTPLHQRSFSWAPSISPQAGGLSLGAAGAF